MPVILPIVGAAVAGWAAWDIAKRAGVTDALGMSAPAGLKIVAAAQRALGQPYVWGGGDIAGPTKGTIPGSTTIGFDCSGLSLFAVYAGTGITLYHHVTEQFQSGRAVTTPQPGDLIFFNITGEGPLSHVGVYVGNAQMIHAPQTGYRVQVDNLQSTYWTSQFAGFRRYS